MIHQKSKILFKGGPNHNQISEVNKLKPAPLISIRLNDQRVAIYKKSCMIDRLSNELFLIYEYVGISPEEPKQVKFDIVMGEK